MLFSSPEFFLFLLVYFVLFYLSTPKLKIPLIIVGSTFFYGYWNPKYVLLPHILTLFAYCAIRHMQKAESPSSRLRRLWGSIFFILLPLLFFKYTNFFYNSFINLAWQPKDKLVDLPLPLGISFVTFTLIAYAVDVYKGKFQEERSFSNLIAFILFFPQLIAGPIMRPSQLIPQIKRQNIFVRPNFKFALMIFTFGLVKKLIFADQIAEVVNAIYANPAGANGLEYLLAIYGYCMQIYCDFSGYTDMAIGAALLFNIRLPTNFKRPYMSLSLVDFWRRWHITLSFWLRDYLYIPLGGKNTSKSKRALNVFIVMVIGGLWHGANWTFVIWGFIHGIAIAISQLLRTKVRKVPNLIAFFVTFHFVTAAWIVFRAETVTDAWTIFKGPFLSDWSIIDVNSMIQKYAFSICLIILFWVTHRFDQHSRFKLYSKKIPTALYYPLTLFIWLLAITVSTGSSAEFIYFDF